MTTKTAQVHRFRDRVAASLGSGETVYLTATEARTFARALNAVAREVGRKPFGSSTVGTVTIPLKGVPND